MAGLKASTCCGLPPLAVLLQASKTAALFTKDGEQLSALHDMQHMWFECAAGAAHLKRKEWGKVSFLCTYSAAKQYKAFFIMSDWYNVIDDALSPSLLFFMQALKQFTTVISHFKEIEEDQFDFHG